MLKNLTIVKKILLLSIICFIGMLYIGGNGIFFLNKSNNDLKNMYNNKLKAIEYLDTCNLTAKSNEANILYIINYNSNSDLLTRKISEIADNAKKNNEAMKKYKALNTDAYEKKNIAVVEENLTQFREVRSKVIELVQAGNTKEASKLLYDNMDLAQKYLEGFQDLINHNVKLADKIQKENSNAYRISFIQLVAAFIISVLISFILSTLISRSISKTLKFTIKHLDNVAKGDFSVDFPKHMLKSKDEAGGIARAVEQMQKAVRLLIENTVNSSKLTVSSVNSIDNSMQELNGNIMEISAITEELAATMEETSASTQEMNANAEEVGKAVESIATEAEKGSTAVLQIKERAENLKDKAINSKDETLNIYKDTEEKLSDAIEKAKAVEKISVLTDSILSITAQTNMLALNASIEAARAGEFGKGFAVVADEIRKLAETSTGAVNEIQDVIKDVIVSVENLSDSSKNILEFIESNVVKDYDMLVETSEQYSSDASFIEKLVSDFSSTSEELHASMQTMVHTIDSIAAASHEAAEGTQNIAERATEISHKTEQVKDDSEKTIGQTEKLTEIIGEFKI